LEAGLLVVALVKVSLGIFFQYSTYANYVLAFPNNSYTSKTNIDRAVQYPHDWPRQNLDAEL